MVLLSTYMWRKSLSPYVSHHIDSCTNCVQNRSCFAVSKHLELHFAWKPVLYLLLFPCTFLLLAACPYPFLRCTCVNKLCSALLCWDLPVGIQSCSRFVSVQTCNSKFRLAKDTWSWLCSCSCIPCIALHHAHVSPTVPPVCFTYVCKQLLHNVYACGHMGVQEWVMISMG